MPKVSICLPSLNTARYLHERFETILAQNFNDWECFVYDSYSDDGSWEIICEYANKDSRIRAQQGPREGIYPAWNRCIRETVGDYIYIATSDDTMADDCLDKLVAALDANPSCGIAHCNLKAIGDGCEHYNSMWEAELLFAKSSGSLWDQPHVRRAPFDALLQFTGHTVYISITQLLIRRELFNRIGLFDCRWGSAGDFHWHMRASLVTDTIHVPSTWGGWRLHASQATSMVAIDSPPYRAKIEEMIDHALSVSWDHLPTELRAGIKSGWRTEFYNRWHFNHYFPLIRGKFAKAWFLVRYTIAGSRSARDYLTQRLTGRVPRDEPPHEVVSMWLDSIGHMPSLKKL